MNYPSMYEIVKIINEIRIEKDRNDEFFKIDLNLLTDRINQKGYSCNSNEIGSMMLSYDIEVVSRVNNPLLVDGKVKNTNGTYRMFTILNNSDGNVIFDSNLGTFLNELVRLEADYRSKFLQNRFWATSFFVGLITAIYFAMSILELYIYF